MMTSYTCLANYRFLTKIMTSSPAAITWQVCLHYFRQGFCIPTSYK